MNSLKHLFKRLYDYRFIAMITFFSSSVLAHHMLSINTLPWQPLPLTTSIVVIDKLANQKDEGIYRKHTQFNRMRLNVL